jgi:hypothetical protein
MKDKDVLTGIKKIISSGNPYEKQLLNMYFAIAGADIPKANQHKKDKTISKCRVTD